VDVKRHDPEDPREQACPQCWGDLIFVVAALRGALAKFQLQAECDRCGLVEVLAQPHEDDVALGTEAISRTHVFPPAPPEASSRPRGLTLADVNAVVRLPRAQRKAAASYLDPPPPPSTRP
jgi:hypothetical protein